MREGVEAPMNREAAEAFIRLCQRVAELEERVDALEADDGGEGRR